MHNSQVLVCSTLFTVALLGGVACSAASSGEPPAGDFAAVSPESEALDIAAWQVEPDAGGARLVGLDSNNAIGVELVVAPSGDEAGSVELRFSHPEVATARLFPDGTLGGEPSTAIAAYAQAVYQDLREPELLPNLPQRASAIGTLEQALSTRSGSFSFTPALFGHNGVRIVGPNPCPNGEARVTAEARARIGRGTCEFDGWRVESNVSDCRFRVEFHIYSFANETCDWSVTSD
jgi:hypothetical protein